MSDSESEFTAMVGVKSTPSSNLQIARPKKRKSAGLRLFEQRDHRDEQDQMNDQDFQKMTDLTFEFRGSNGDKCSAPAHKAILYDASQILKSMIRRRLKDVDQAKLPPRQARKSAAFCVDKALQFYRRKLMRMEVTIKIPSDLIQEDQVQVMEAIEIFLKYVYTDQRLRGTVGLRMLLAVLQLANYFGVEDLIENCCELLGKRVEKDKANFVLIFEKTLPLRKTGVYEMAFGMVKRYLKSLMDGDEMLDWNENTWRSLLVRSEPLDVDEVTLFDAMMQWKMHDVVNREEAFKRLVKCIRFWMMPAPAITDKVDKTGILSKEELVDLFVFFNSGSRVFQAMSAEELHRLLHCVPPGSIIVLQKHVYDGSFLLKTDEIKIIGRGPESVIKGNLMIDANRCQIDGVKFESINTKPVVKMEVDVGLIFGGPPSKKSKKDEHGQHVISMNGNSNCLKNVTIFPNESNSDKSRAIICLGDENKLTCIYTKVPSITVWGNRNRVELLTCFQVPRGLVINGDNNTISDIVWFPRICSEETSGDSVGILVTGGVGNVLESICYFQYPAVTPEGWLMLKVKEATKENIIQNCAIGSGNVFLNGERHTVDNVVVPPHFSLKLSGQDHKLSSCFAEELKNLASGGRFDDCDFSDFNL